MAQQVYKQRQTVRRIDECVREQEARDHEEMLNKARSAARKARHAISLAQSLVDQINEMV